ncbi:DUF4175 family protein [Winogradskyella aurantiaca]|uniref:DUF4175 family protein n=1 Tax=Winogradskyella aurantiaca TaxID=2219558 RepID=UPI001E429B64|nr:DUF4175 family protein [Winogradskyella aurantiaca]
MIIKYCRSLVVDKGAMGSFELIKEKLEGFIRKYYLNDLIKGAILFLAFGLLYLLATVFVEYLLWLESGWRTLLFWCFVVVELFLFGRFIALPLAKLFKLKSGISYDEASKIIGEHFPNVNDRLLNVLQLSKNKTQSDLLLASIDQKSRELEPIPFKTAIDFKANIKYTRYMAIPVVILLLSLLTDNFNWFSNSYERVVNYQTAYEPPSPFQFFIVNDNLEAIENAPFVLEVRTSGSVIPEAVQLQYNNESYFLQPKGNGQFQFVFTQLTDDIIFELYANEVNSQPYELKVLKTPSLEYLEMELQYPRHTGKQNEIIKSSGNAIVPEGTTVNWNVKTREASEVKIYAQDTLQFTQEEQNAFKAQKQLFSNYAYALVSSNLNLKDYERLAYNVKVVKDAYPELSIKSKLDSLDQQTLYFFGQASDDYGLRALNLVYYEVNNPEVEQRVKLPIGAGNYSEFVNAFPDQIELKEGVPYELYFEVVDNDRIHGFKSTKSQLFSYRKRTAEEEQTQQLQQQSETIKKMDDTFKKLDDQDKKLEEFSKTQKEKEALNFNDRKKFQNFLKRQKQQEELMKSFNKNLQENLQEFNKEEQDPFKEELQQRLKDNEQQLEKDEKLLEELERMQDKINKEEFSQKLDELAKQNKNKKRSMKQLLELTKRYYVAKKAEKVQGELEQLAEEQKKLSEDERNNSSKNQEKLNEEFSKIRDDLDKLKKDNSALQKPMSLPEDKLTEERIEKDQQDATEQLEKKESEQSDKGGQPEEMKDQEEQKKAQQKAQQKQKAAAQKMKKMSDNLKKMQQSGGGMGGAQQMQEDAEMLRQILDNLVLFSFDEEKLMNQFKSIDIDNNQYGKYIVDQSTLRTHFEHVDDSLFALSLRQPKLSENVNKQISNVYFNIDKALGQLSENRLYQGISYQQYTITAANELASFLSDMLDNMEQQLNMMPGSGGGSGEQLQDIIISQEELNKMMQEGMEKAQGQESGNQSENKGKGEGEEGEQKGEQQGENGEEGQEGNEGEEGENGEQGEGGKDSNDGKNGGEGDGKNGDGNSDNNGYGEGNSEEMNKELYEIYQKQQQLRQALENKIQESSGETQQEIKNLIEKMEEVELDLINNGFTNQTMEKMLDLQHRLLKLENATFLQGKEERRESETNLKQFEGSNSSLEKAKEYFNRTEALNRQTLPLKDNYKKKVQQYFKTNNDQL